MSEAVRSFYAILLVAFLLTMVGCGGETEDSSGAKTVSNTPAVVAAPEEPDTPKKGPHLALDNLIHDFGVMSETESRTGIIRFTNDGDEVLLIIEVTTTCGCTVAEPDKKQYKPGESGEIRATFDPTGPNEPGNPQRKFVKVFSNSVGEKNPIEITIVADVRAFVFVEPRMVEFGVVQLGETKTADVQVYSTDPDFTIETIKVTNPYLDGTLIEESDDAIGEHGKTQIVRMSVQPDAPWGNLFGWLEIVVNGRPSPDAESITYTSRIRVQAQVFGELLGDPDTFRFGVAPGEAFDRTITFTHRDGTPFQIYRAEIECTSVHNAEVTIDQIAPDKVEVTMRAVGDELSGMPSRNGRGTVVIETSIAGPESRIEIPIVGVVRPPIQH